MPVYQKKIVTNGDMSADVTSQVLNIADLSLGSIQAIFTGAPTGDLFLQISNDIIAAGSDPNTAVVNWSEYTGSRQTLAAAGAFVFNLANMGYKWCRMVYDPSGGTGILNATATVKNA